MKLNRHILIGGLLWFCCIGGLRGEGELLFRHLNRTGGLLHDNVTCIAQDSTGYVWFGTHRGLNRYDGYSIDSYKYENGKLNSINYNRVYDIRIMGEHLWLATEAGLACFDLKTKQFVEFQLHDRLDHDFYSDVRLIRPGTDNQLWLLSGTRVRVVQVTTHPEESRTVQLEARKIGDNYEFLSVELNPRVAMDGKGRTWITGGELHAYRKNEEGDHLLLGTVGNWTGSGVRDIWYDNGELWIAYLRQLVRYRIEGEVFILQAQLEPDTRNGIASLFVDPDYVWVNVTEALLQIPKDTDPLQVIEHRHASSQPYSIGSDINNIFVDRSQNLWVSTWGSGVSYANASPRFFRTVPFATLSPEQSLRSEFISALHAGKDGHIYMGSKLGGLSRFTPATRQVIPGYCVSPQLLASITSIESDEQFVYAAVQDEVIIIRKSDRQVVTSFRTDNGGYIFSIVFDKYKRMWITTYAGLECFENKEGTWTYLQGYGPDTPEPYKLSSHMLHNIYSDTVKNELLITSAKGLNRMIFDRDGRVRQVVKYLAKENDTQSLSSNFLWPIDKASDSVYWIGTMGSGLNKVTLRDYPDGTFGYVAAGYGMESGATSNDIESIEVDRFGNVWCGGFYLSCFNEQAGRFSVFDATDGLQSHVFGTSSSCKDEEETIYFGGAQGVNYFTPAPQQTGTIPWPVYFTRYAVNGEVIPSGVEYTRRLMVSYPDNNFSVDFTSLSYDLQKHIRYRYKLEGYDNDWRYIEMGKTPTVSYQKIPYGKHKLVVESGDWKEWSGRQYILRVKSLPPFWLTWWAYALYALLLIGLVYVAFRYFIRWMQMKNTIAMQREEDRRKEEMIRMKMRFFTDVSHEFRTPLTLINSAITGIEEEQQIRSANRFNVIKRNTGRLLKLVNELLDFHRSDVHSARLRTSYISVSEYIRCIYEEFRGWAGLSQITMTLELPEEEIYMWVDPEHFSKILSNLLSNSIRYSNPGSAITVRVEIGEAGNLQTAWPHPFRNVASMVPGEQLIVRITDSGVGIAQEQLPEIFERFHQENTKAGRNPGSGIGLSLVKSLVQLHRGGIVVSSKLNSGTEFCVLLPLQDSWLKPEEKISETTFSIKEYLSDYAVEYEPVEIEESISVDTDGKPTILLVDDNHEILMVLREYLIKDYHIIMAIDGQEALEKCNTYYPDLVISDVMMPKMNGIELCTHLKESLRTCFIPVILLTAKVLIEHQIEGIETGADAYIPKPFNFKLLKATIRNLLNKGQQIKKTLPVDNIRQHIIDKKQEELFGKLEELVLANLTNSDFSVDHLCLELGLNRTKLYSTVKSVTGMTLANYIRKIRLDKAAELLKTTSLSISEVGYSIGIESPAYFTRSFKEQFGVSPSEYIKKK